MGMLETKQYVYKTMCFVHIFIDVVSSTANSSTAKPNESQQYFVQEKEKSFPVWLIGVIILSSIALIVLVATIVQRILRHRADRNEQYRMTS